MSATPPASRFSKQTVTVPALEDTKMKTSPTSEDDAMTDVGQLEEDDHYEEEDAEDFGDDEDDENDEGSELGAKDEDDDEEYESDVKQKPAATKPIKNRRNIGGSTKGRRCERWTPVQEDAAAKHMLLIHDEGELLGDKKMVELQERLVGEFGAAWNHTLSGLYNAWHRRGLNKRFQREGERAKAKKEQEQALEDSKLGIAPRVLLAAPILTESFPTVEICFKNRSNNTRRTRSFGSFDTITKLWSQAAVAGVFGEIGDFMVLSAVVGSARNAHLMAQGDENDYDKLMEKIARAVEDAGGAKVVLHIKAYP